MSTVEAPRDASGGVLISQRRSTAATVVRVVAWLAVALFLIAFPLVAGDYQTGLMAQFLTYGLLAMSLDFLGDRGGLLSFGHGAWFGLGAYALGLTLERIPGAGGTYLGFLLAVLVAGGFAALLGSLLLLGRQRVGGVYFGIVTLAVAAILQLVVNAWSSFTGGSNGLYGFATPELGGDLVLAGSRIPYYVTAVVCVAVYLFLRAGIGSTLGLALLAARQNAKRAESLGISVGAGQLLVFTIAGAIAGLAGALYVPVGFISSDLFGLTFSTYAIVWMVVGGRGTLIGGFVGAIGLSELETILSGTFVSWWLLIVGVLLIAVILVWPRGVMGALATVARWLGV
jgi:ABC-type branched-subunit amino acid transport system permease subunit